MSERRLRRLIGLTALIGLAVAAYLTYVHYAELAGVPVAVLGLGGYALILASLWLPGDNGRIAGALLALVGFGFSAYLTWLELFEIDAICQWCVASAVLMTILAVATSWRLVRPA